MKRLLLVIISMAMVVFNGCQSGNYETVKFQGAQASLSTGASLQRMNIDGDWLTFFHCQGNDYLLEAKIQTDGHSLRIFFSGQAELMKMPLHGRSGSRAQTVSSNLVGIYDSELNSFVASSPSGSHGLKL